MPPAWGRGRASTAGVRHSVGGAVRDHGPQHPHAVPASRGEGAAEEPRAAPGRQDLEAAVQRLSARQQSHASEERSFFEVEREHKLWRLRDGESSSGFLTPNESIVSTGTNYSGSSELTVGSGFSLGSLTYLPDKLQIVKPLEGEGWRGLLGVQSGRCQEGPVAPAESPWLCVPPRLCDAPPLAAAGTAQPGRDPGAPSGGAHQRLQAAGH